MLAGGEAIIMITLDAQELLNRFPSMMAKLGIVCEKSAEDIVMQTGRQLAKDLVTITPPTPQSGDKSTSAAVRRIGEAAVERDIKKIFYDAGKIKLDDPGLARLLRKGDFETLKRQLKPGNFLEEYEIATEPLRRLHNAQRDRRGRVRREPRKKYLVTERGALQKYIKRKRSAVGYMRSGWLDAAQNFGSAIPAWVARHGSRGDFSKSVHAGGIRVVFSNATRTIGAANRDKRILREALSHRLEMMKKQYEKVLQNRIKRGFTVSGGDIFG